MIKQIFTTLLISTISILLKAGPVTPEEASTVAKNHYWQHASGIQYTDILPELVFTKISKDIPAFYVFNIGTDMGFVIVAADDDIYPILGYSFDNHYDVNKISYAENYSSWMENYTEQIVYVREKKLKADENISGTWHMLGSFSPALKGINNVNPLVWTSWDQGLYYNELCPADPDGPGGHVWTGCNATAVAQIMKYYNHPYQGQGSNSYYISPYGTLSADFGATTYNWSSMPGRLETSNLSVATLLYHCGVSMNMQYSVNGSGSYSEDSRDAFVTHFKYASEAQYIHKSNYSNSDWINLLTANLDIGRPVFYDGGGPGGGHAFICDGYQTNNYFHFNWGWGGYFDGYFYLSALNPGGNQFSNDQDAIINIYPAGISYLNPPLNLEGTVENNAVSLVWNPPSTKGTKNNKALKGYYVYRNGLKIAYIASTNFKDEGLNPGTYNYCVSAVYDEGESNPVCATDYTITELIPDCDFYDDFESYNVSQQLVIQNSANWTTWDNSSGSALDPYIVSYGSNVVEISGTTDLVYVIPNLTEGFYTMSFDMFIPNGADAYFNILQQFAGGDILWGMDAYFGINNAGEGNVFCGEANPAVFTFNYSSWMQVELRVDLNTDWAEFYLDNVLIHGWIWSTGTGSTTLNQLGGVNFYAWNEGINENSLFYIDNFCYTSSAKPPTNLTGPNYVMLGDPVHISWDAPAKDNKSISGYNIYRKINTGEFIKISSATTEEFFDVSYPGMAVYTYYVTALYNNWQESDPSNVWLVYVGTASVDDKVFDNTQIFPNPATDVVKIKADHTIISVSVFNYTGQMIYTKGVENSEYMLNTSQFDPGIYIFRIETTEGTLSKRILIKKG